MEYTPSVRLAVRKMHRASRLSREAESPPRNECGFFSSAAKHRIPEELNADDVRLLSRLLAEGALEGRLMDEVGHIERDARVTIRIIAGMDIKEALRMERRFRLAVIERSGVRVVRRRTKRESM